MNTKLFLLTAALIGLGTFNASAVIITVPSAGTCVRTADTIVKGTFDVAEDGVFFRVASTIKGEYKPQQRILVTKSRFDFVDLKRDVSKYDDEECFILGERRDDGIFLTWNSASIWPSRYEYEGSERKSMFKEKDFCSKFIATILDYEQLEQTDPQALATHIIHDVQNEQKRPFALAYLDSAPDNSGTQLNYFGGNPDLYNDVLRIIAMYIITRYLDNDWAFEYMLRLSPSRLPSVALPYFMQIAHTEGRKAEDARKRLPSMVILPRETDYETAEAHAKKMLPYLRQIDAEKNIHLFDSPNEAIAESASLVFSAIFDIPAPKNMTRAQEKAFWQTKMDDKITKPK